MKVLFVAQFAGTGGVEMVIRNRWLAMRDAHHVSALFLYGEPGTRAGDRLAEDVRVTAARWEIEMRAREADVVCVIDTPQAFAAVDASRRPIIVEVHTAYEHQRRYLQRPLPARTARVVVPTRAFATVVERELRDRRCAVDVVPNPIDPALFEDEPREPQAHARPVMWIGRFDRLKNWRAAIEVFRRLRPSSLELSMYGYRGREPLAAALTEAGVLGATRIWPPIDRAAMAEHHRACARAGGVHLSTSTGESFGMAVAEAMAAGVPCVVPNVPALEEVTGGQAAYFTTPEQAAAAIERLVDDPSYRGTMTRALRERARAFHPAEAGSVLVRTLEECR